MATITTDLDVARRTLEETDDLATEEILLKGATISFESTPEGGHATMTVEEEAIRLSEYSLKQLATMLEIPAAYMVKCPPSLQATNLDHWQKQLSDRERARVIMGGKMIQAIASPNYIPVKNVPVFDVLVDKISRGKPDNLTLDRFEHDWIGTRIALTNSSVSHKVNNTYFKPSGEAAQKDDIVRAGVHFLNSLVNETHTELQPFMLRLFCTNGALMPAPGADRGVIRFKNDGSVPTADWMQTTIDEIGSTYEELFSQIDAAANTVLSNPAQALRDQLRHIPGPLRDSVVNAYSEEPIPTQWGIANALTRATQNTPSTRLNHRIGVERNAGWLMSSTDLCSECGRPKTEHEH